MKKGQPEINNLDQKKRCYSEDEGSHQILKTPSDLEDVHQTWKTSRLKRSIQTPRQIYNLM